MGLMNISGTQPVPDAHAFRTQEELGTNIIHGDELSVDMIKYQVDGMRMTVDYFNQILGVNSAALAPDINIPETELKYNRIDKLDIYVDGGLPASAAIDLIGTGRINAGFVPHYGDAFTMTVSGGRIGIFVLTEVRKEYYNTHDLYGIDFKLMYFADQSVAAYNDLVYKTVRVYVYDKTAVGTPRTPIILANDYVKRIDMARQPSLIMKHYVDTFRVENNRYLCLPTSGGTYIDQLVTRSVFRLTDVSDVPELASVERVASDITGVTIWDAMFSRDIDMLTTCIIDIGYALRPATGSLASRKLRMYLDVGYMLTDAPGAVAGTPVVKDNPLSTRKIVVAPRTQPVDKYLFTAAFYTQDPNVTLTPFETAVLGYLRGELPDRTTVETAIADYKHWNYDDQYALLPILVILIKTLVNNSYSAV